MTKEHKQVKKMIDEIKAQKNYGCDFIEDFDFNPVTEQKFHMWAASSAVDGGIDDADLLLVYNVTPDDLRKYYEENPNNVPPAVRHTKIIEKGKLIGEYVDPFEHTPEFALQMRVWSADEAYYLGMDEESVTRMYNLTKEEVKNYYEQYPDARILEHHQKSAD
jgi:hypothetical protein